MCLSNRTDAFHTNAEIEKCDNHKNGNGRDCEWISDSEYYSQNTLDQNVTVK